MSVIPHLSVAQQKWPFIWCRYLPLHTRFISICKQFFRPNPRVEIRLPTRVFHQAGLSLSGSEHLYASCSIFGSDVALGGSVGWWKMGKNPLRLMQSARFEPKTQQWKCRIEQVRSTWREPQPRTQLARNVFKSVGGNSVVWKPLQLTVLSSDFPFASIFLTCTLGRSRNVWKTIEQVPVCVCVRVWVCLWQKWGIILDKSSASTNYKKKGKVQEK